VRERDVVERLGSYPAPHRARSTNTAICARVTDASGQYVVPVQPEVMPSVRSASMWPANVDPASTSVKRLLFDGGVQFEARIVRSRNAAICRRVTAASGQ
jgi:hypothetical protein